MLLRCRMPRWSLGAAVPRCPLGWLCHATDTRRSLSVRPVLCPSLSQPAAFLVSALWVPFPSLLAVGLPVSALWAPYRSLLAVGSPVSPPWVPFLSLWVELW